MCFVLIVSRSFYFSSMVVVRRGFGDLGKITRSEANINKLDITFMYNNNEICLERIFTFILGRKYIIKVLS